jgi:NADPH:quinone reductase-like Zn-dependent oxidoreductase
MKAFRLSEVAGKQVLIDATVPRPQPGPGELLIRIVAAGVTPTELLWYPTTHTKAGETRSGAIPGHEFSGVIEQTGDAVFGMNDWFADGATAEYCLAPYSAVAPKPRSLTHAEAATVPISALTAWQGLLERARLQPGQRILVHGGAGAVGIFAVQLAKLHGAHVTATVSEHDLKFVASLGADAVIDHRASRFEDAVRELDVVFDTVGGETLQRSWSVLGPGGKMVTVAASEEGVTDDRTKAAYFIVEPNRKQLAEIGALLEAHRLRTFVAAAVPFSQAPEAYSGKIAKQGPGKVVVEFREMG